MPFSKYLRDNAIHSWDPAYTDDPHDDEVSRIYEVSKCRGNAHDPCIEIDDNDEEFHVGVDIKSWNTCAMIHHINECEDEVNKGKPTKVYFDREWSSSLKDDDCEYEHDDE